MIRKNNYQMIFIVLLFIFIFSGCSNDSPVNIMVGKWHNEDTNESWEFSEERKWRLYSGSTIVLNGYYEIIDETTIRLLHDSLSTVEGVVRLAAKRNSLRITAPYLSGGISSWYERVD